MNPTAHDLTRLAAAPHGVRGPLPALFLTAGNGTRLQSASREVPDRYGSRPVQCAVLTARRGTGLLLATLATYGAN